MSLAVHYSSLKIDWRTPRTVFDALDAEFRFTVDACSNADNGLLERHWTEADEPLARSWARERVYMNPPYGKEIVRWMAKAWNERHRALVVALVPSRTDTAWWHDYVMPADELRFLRGRIRFGGDDGDLGRAPFPSAVVVYGLALGQPGFSAACARAKLLAGSGQ